MGLRVNTNIPALIALRHLTLTDARRQLAFEHMSTGVRINRASEDPTGLALSEGLRSDIRSLEQATQNNESADNLLTTADAALAEIQDLLIGIKASIVSAMNGPATPSQIAAEQDFVDSSLSAIDRIAASTRFGEINLLNGQSGFTVQNVDAAGIRAVVPEEVRFNPLVDPTPFSLTIVTPPNEALDVDAVVTFEGVTFTGQGATVALNTPTFRGTVELVDLAPAGAYTWEIARSGLLLQIGPKAMAPHQMTTGIPDVSTASLGLPVDAAGADGFLSTIGSGLANDLFTNPDNAAAIVDLAVEQISRFRSNLGAISAQILEPARRTNEVAIENLSAADSSLRDADFAEEMAEQIRTQVLFESGIAVLSQASLLPRAVLKLLE